MSQAVRLSSVGVSVSVLAALLGACAPSADEVRARHQAGGSSSSGNAGAVAVAAATPVAAPREAGARDAELVAAVGLSKIKLPLEVRFLLDARPVIGQPVTIELVVTPAQLAQIRSMQFRLQPGPGLLLQGDAALPMASAGPGVAIRHDIVVVPQTAGVLQLEALATVETTAETLSQTYVIPLVLQPVANPG